MKIWLMFKKPFDQKDWLATDNVYFSAKSARAACQQFTAESVGWKYKPFRFVLG